MERTRNGQEQAQHLNSGENSFQLKTVLMVGGKGIRLEPVTKNLIPKGFVTIDDEQKVKGIDHLITTLRYAGITDPLLSVHHYSGAYEEYAATKEPTLRLFKRTGEAGNGGALGQLIERYGYGMQYLVVAADIFINPKDVQKLITQHKPGTISWGVTQLDYDAMEPYFGLVVDDSTKAILGDVKLPWWKNWDLAGKSLYLKGAIQVIDPIVYMESLAVFKRLCNKNDNLDLYWDISPLVEERNRRRITRGKSSILQATVFDYPTLDYGTPERLDLMRREYQKLINE